MTPADNDTHHQATATLATQTAGTATQRLEHSRERMRRYMLRTAAGNSQRQNAARSKRQVWVGVALVVALVLAWQQPWRRASGLARAAAFVVAGLKVPGLLSMLASRMDMLMAWWHTFAQAPADTNEAASKPPTDESNAGEGLEPDAPFAALTPLAANPPTHTETPARSQRSTSPAH